MPATCDIASRHDERAPRAPAPARTALEAAALLAILALGVYVRVDDLAGWRAQAALAFHDGLPLLINLDGYFFLSLARDLLEGGYAEVDLLRAAPEGAPRPHPAPLLAVATAGLSLAVRAPLEWVAALLPALAGPLVALPVYAIARRLEGPVAGIAAALIAVLSHYLVYRSTVGFHDTDCLNVAFTMALCWWSLGLAGASRESFPAWLAGGVALYLAFLWWWFGAAWVVTALAGWSLSCALLARRPTRRELVTCAATSAAVAAAAVAWRGPQLPGELLASLGDSLSHVSKAPRGDFPNVAVSIGEQLPASLTDLAEKTVGHALLLALAAAGLAWLLLAHRRAGAVLLAPLALALLSVLFAQRFLVFAAPMTGLGLGLLAARAAGALGRRRWTPVAVAALVLAAAAPSYSRSTGIVFMPTASSELVGGMRWLADQTPADAVVWAMWDYGYTVRYFARRATVNDGSVHTGELTVYNALPYAATSFRQAANFMQFYAVHGAAGMRRLAQAAGGTAAGLALARAVFAAGPGGAPAALATAGLAPPGQVDGWIRFLFPPRAPALYLLTEQRMLASASWWHWFGNWDPEHGARRREARMQPHYGLALEGARITGASLEVDLERGTLAAPGGPVQSLSRVVLSDPGGLRQRVYPGEGRELHVFLPQRMGVLQDPAVARSVFNKAFVLKAAAQPWFQAASAWSGDFQIWRVRGDRP